jgi:hypothetical protein
MKKSGRKSKGSRPTPDESSDRDYAGRSKNQRADKETAFRLGIPKDKMRMNRDGEIVGASTDEEDILHELLSKQKSNTKARADVYKRYQRAAVRNLIQDANRGKAR